jgi:hypothetical protein
MKPFYFAFFALQMLVFQVANCQKYSSCETAFEICSKESLHFQFNKDSINAYQIDQGECLILDYPTTWLKWEIAEPGILSFVIVPDKFAEDIDFALYRLSENGNCESKILQRCMNSGMNIGNVKSSINCLGATGLSIKEPKNEVKGDAGCKEGYNNFLAALECKKGETYALAIQNYDNSSGAFSIDFCGNAKLPCDSLTCLEFKDKRKRGNVREVVIFKESIAKDSMPISLYISALEPVMIRISDEHDVPVLTYSVFPKPNQNTYYIPLKGLPPKKYNIALKIKNRCATGSFFIAE